MNTTQKLAVFLILAVLILLSAGPRFSVEAQNFESVELAPITGVGAAQPSDYRWRDVVDNIYNDSYRANYGYSQAQVNVTFSKSDPFFEGTLTASNLKPNFAYQLKLVGIPDTSSEDILSNERIGLTGRWWQEEWSDAAWTGGQNLNNKSNGLSPNPNDDVYFARRDIPYVGSPTGLRYRFTGYLLFGYFITDSQGNATLDFQTDSSYHVLWKNSQRNPEAGDGPLDTVTFSPNSTQPAYLANYPSSTVSIYGEWERLPQGGVFLPSGEYSCEVVLTEESFHGSVTYAGNWAGALEGNISFTIEQMPTPTVPFIPMGPIAAFASMITSLGIIGAISHKRRTMRAQI